MIDQNNGLTAAFWWLQAAVLACVVVAGLSVVDTGYIFVLFFQYKLNFITAQAYPELVPFFTRIDQSPFLFLSSNLYNIIIWVGVLLCVVWLYRFKIWARKILRFLLCIDIFFTLLQLIYLAWVGTLQIDTPGEFIFLNTLQIFSIIVFSHPKVIEKIQWVAEQRSTKQH